MQETGQKSSLGSKIAKQVIALGVGGLFLWLAFRNADVGKIWGYAKEVDPLYLLFFTLSVLASHVCRAYRWNIFLAPLSPRKISLFNSFSAIMMCYAVNLVIPRGGEVVRIVSISKSEGLPWAGVLPTMLIDRLLDLCVLCLIFAVTIPVLPAELLAKMPFLRTGGVLMAIFSVTVLIALPKISHFIRLILAIDFVKKILPPKILLAVEKLGDQFQEGTKSMSNFSTYPAVLLSTLIMWALYFLNQYLLILGFHLGPQIDLMQQWIIYTVGSVGVLIPSPGSIGSFHFFVSQAMMLAAHVNEELALAFATVMHLFSFIIIPCITAFICGLIQANSAAKTPPAEKPLESVVPKAQT